MQTYKTPREKLLLRYYEAGQRGEQIHVEQYAGADCAAHYAYLCSLPGIGDGLKAMIAAGGSFPERQVDHVVFFKYGYLLFITLNPAPDAHEIFIRFAKVFEQTYTRFLDLQKAEAQTAQAGLDLLEIKAARRKAEETLLELQATQKQLIQSEKMASLGELTAGIAHEIQNPLDFVNNFSEVSPELIDELKSGRGSLSEQEFDSLLHDIDSNLEKINYHGRRADGIVKGMLQHSQSGRGVKDPTDLNGLIEEYVRLAVHGARAKDALFNVEISMDLDPNVELINVVPQDIGRVMLNLLSNAFWAVGEKAKSSGEDYQRVVSIVTRSLGDKMDISAGDNGIGIPKEIRDKIFQPFFTTKPTGQNGVGVEFGVGCGEGRWGSVEVCSLKSFEAKLIIIFNCE